MKNLKIKVKLAIGFVAILLLLVVLNAFSIVNMKRLATYPDTLYDGPHMASLYSVATVNQINEIDVYLKTLIMNNSNDVDAQFDTLISNLENYLEYLSSVSSLNQTAISEIKTSTTDFITTANQIANLIRQNKISDAKSLLLGSSSKLSSMKSTAGTLSESMNDTAEQFIRDADKNAQFTIIFQDVLFGLIVLVSIFTIFKMSSVLTVPIKKLEKNMEEISKGNLNVEFDTSSQDELGMLSINMKHTIDSINSYIKDITQVLGQIAEGNIDAEVTASYEGDFLPIKESLNNIIKSLNSTMRRIREASEQVSAGSENVASGASILSEGTIRQSQDTDMLLSAVNRVYDSTVQDAQNAEKINTIAFQAVTDVKIGNEHMQNMTSAMENINSASNEIAKIVNLIDNIAFQTNILALNAAVEAARAGAAGKGFSVVAEEVRNLATKSAEAAKKTTDLISNSIQAVDDGAVIAREAAESLSTVIANVSEVASLVGNITESTDSQVKEMTSIKSIVESISSIVESNAGTAEESSASSEELSGQAQALKELVSEFRLKGEGATA